MANFNCPDCGEPALRIRHVIELPSDSRSDEICLQLLRCDECGLRVAAFYEESRRAGESIDHYGIRVDDEWYERFQQQIKNCPLPRNRRCNCPSHKELGGRDDRGRLRLFQGLDRANTFALIIEHGRKLDWPRPSPATNAVISSPAMPAGITTVGRHSLTPDEIDLLDFPWPPVGMGGPAFQPDENGRVDLDEALKQLRQSLAFWLREYDAISGNDHGGSGNARDTLGIKVTGLRDAITAMERLIARLDC